MQIMVIIKDKNGKPRSAMHVPENGTFEVVALKPTMVGEVGSDLIVTGRIDEEDDLEILAGDQTNMFPLAPRLFCVKHIG